jgi:hypothetical protein
MDMETERRIARLEEQVAMLCRLLGLNGTEEYLPPSPLLPPPALPLPLSAPSAPGGPQDAVPGAFAAIASDGTQLALPPEFYAALENNKPCRRNCCAPASNWRR